MVKLCSEILPTELRCQQAALRGAGPGVALTPILSGETEISIPNE